MPSDTRFNNKGRRTKVLKAVIPFIAFIALIPLIAFISFFVVIGFSFTTFIPADSG